MFGSRQGTEHRFVTLIAFYFAIASLMSVLDKSGLFDRANWLIYDSWVRLNQSSPDSDLVIVGIDWKSVRENGRWPWSRANQAKIIENIAASGARTIVVKIFYDTHDLNNPEDDALLAYAVKKAGNVVLPIMEIGSDGGLPIPALAAAAKSMGHVFLPIDADGIVRRVYLKGGFGNAYWSYLSLAAMEAYNVAPSPLPGVEHEQSLGGTKWVGAHEVLIPLHGPIRTFQTVSAVDVLLGEYQSSVFQDAVVFFGLTGVGLGEAVPTPLLGTSAPLPGIELTANIYSALRAGGTISEAPSYFRYCIAALLIATLLAIYTRWRPIWGFFWTLVFTIVPIGLSLLFYRLANTWFAPLVLSGTIFIAFVAWSWIRVGFLVSVTEQKLTGTKIFISYRRSDAEHAAGRLYDRLCGHFGQDEIFYDADKIPSGIDFPTFIKSMLDECAVLIVLIGSRWLQEDDEGKRKIDDEADWVRIEIETALSREINVIPVLISEIGMPAKSDLPNTLKPITSFQYRKLPSNRDFKIHANRLIMEIQGIVGPEKREKWWPFR